jgi:hypothetical protein
MHLPFHRPHLAGQKIAARTICRHRPKQIPGTDVAESLPWLPKEITQLLPGHVAGAAGSDGQRLVAHGQAHSPEQFLPSVSEEAGERRRRRRHKKCGKKVSVGGDR